MLKRKKDNRYNLTGVYKIENILTGDFYIGSARKTFGRRFSSHKYELKNNKHKNKFLQNAYNKYGHSNFLFSIIEIILGEENILNKEQELILKLNPKYNLTKNVRQPQLGKPLSLEHKEKLKNSLSGKAAWNKGKKFSKKTRDRMSKSKKGIKHKNPRPKGLSNKAVIRNDGKMYSNVYYAALDLDVKQNTITKALTDKTRIRKVKGFVFKYIDAIK